MTFHYNPVGSYCIIYKTNSVLLENNFSTYIWNIMERLLCVIIYNNIINCFTVIIIITIFDIFLIDRIIKKIVYKNIKS